MAGRIRRPGPPHPLFEAAVYDELIRVGAPGPVGGGLLAAAAIIASGTAAQKDYFLPRIRSGQHIWCQLFSEPDAGSDLAGLRTRARRSDDHFVVDGQKVWTTNGQYADWGYLLARTDPDAPKHAGITAFALDMTTPGSRFGPCGRSPAPRTSTRSSSTRCAFRSAR